MLSFDPPCVEKRTEKTLPNERREGEWCRSRARYGNSRTDVVIECMFLISQHALGANGGTAVSKGEILLQLFHGICLIVSAGIPTHATKLHSCRTLSATMGTKAPPSFDKAGTLRQKAVPASLDPAHWYPVEWESTLNAK